MVVIPSNVTGILLGTIASASWSLPGSASTTPTTTSFTPQAETVQVAQFYPAATRTDRVLMVKGEGRVTAPADKAEIEFIFSNYDLSAYYTDSEDTASKEPATDSPSASETAPPPTTPITRGMLQPVVDALVASGIPTSDIKVTLGSETLNNYPYYAPEGASISLNLSQPTTARIDELISTVEEAISDKEGLYFQDRYVKYSTEHCDELKQEAYITAINDARDRANILASAMAVKIEEIPSVAETPFDVGSFFGILSSSSPCDATRSSLSRSPYEYTPPSYYDPTLSPEVEVQRELFVTYPIRR